MAEESGGRKREDAATQAPAESRKSASSLARIIPRGRAGSIMPIPGWATSIQNGSVRPERLVTGKDKPSKSAGEDEIDKAEE